MFFNKVTLNKSKLHCLYNCFQLLSYSSKVPKYPQCSIDKSKLPPATKIDKETIEQLEKVSLVEFGNEKGILIVEEAIRFADQIRVIDTDGVEPLLTVLEKRYLPLREDVVNDGDCKEDILRNSKLVEEDYFVAPPGNIPLETKDYNIKNPSIKSSPSSS